MKCQGNTFPRGRILRETGEKEGDRRKGRRLKLLWTWAVQKMDSPMHIYTGEATEMSEMGGGEDVW